MQENGKLKTISEQKKFTIYDSWERFGITKHWGVINATRRLIELCNITLGQYIMISDVGRVIPPVFWQKIIRLRLSLQTSDRRSWKR